MTSYSRVFTDKLFDRLFTIYLLVRLVQEKFPRQIKLERTGISADTRETTSSGPGAWTGLKNYRTLELMNLPSISPQSDFLG